jgi:hypothetical protein
MPDPGTPAPPPPSTSVTFAASIRGKPDVVALAGVDWR